MRVDQQERESQIERFFCNEIEKDGGRTYKFVSPNQAGVPDRIVITWFGAVLFVEFKTSRGKLSKLQRYQHLLLRRLKQKVITIYGMKDAERCLRVLKRGGVGK